MRFWVSYTFSLRLWQLFNWHLTPILFPRDIRCVLCLYQTILCLSFLKMSLENSSSSWVPWATIRTGLGRIKKGCYILEPPTQHMADLNISCHIFLLWFLFQNINNSWEPHNGSCHRSTLQYLCILIQMLRGETVQEGKSDSMWDCLSPSSSYIASQKPDQMHHNFSWLFYCLISANLHSSSTPPWDKRTGNE